MGWLGGMPVWRVCGCGCGRVGDCGPSEGSVARNCAIPCAFTADADGDRPTSRLIGAAQANGPSDSLIQLQPTPISEEQASTPFISI
jgi:hypothetical protein